MIKVITDTQALAAFCKSVEQETYITVDTEFLREKTYYPELCLVQVAGSKDAAAIDPLAAGISLEPFYELLCNPNVLKVFHACRQDIEIFYNAMKVVPAPIWDTQIAAMVCGYGESVGYEALVSKIAGQALDKSLRFTDWSKRPLSDRQLQYAMDDVLHLRTIYEAFRAQLAERGRDLWIEEEMQDLLQPGMYEVNPDEVWRKLRVRNTSPRYLALVQAVARWRELVARARNIPRGRVMKDELVPEVAINKPNNFEALQSIRGFYPTLQAGQYDGLFAAIMQAMALPVAECPRLPEKIMLSDGAEARADLLRLFLRACALKNQVVPRLIADKDDIEALAAGIREGISSLHGWRYTLFGKKALKLLSGNIALKADDAEGLVFVEL